MFPEEINFELSLSFGEVSIQTRLRKVGSDKKIFLLIVEIIFN